MSEQKVWMATFTGSYDNPQHVVVFEYLSVDQHRRLRKMFGPQQEIDHVWDDMPDGKNHCLAIRLNHWRDLASE